MVVFGLFVLYVVFSLSFVIIFVILLAVSISSVCSLENISVFFTFVELVVCILLHSSSIFFTSSILVRALKMVDASILHSLFMHVFLVPGFQGVLLSRYCVLVYPCLVHSHEVSSP